uniref:Uncharacterized protein n=1 Tax=Hyaloperonospora arabidopsidis (strain Emoy2) TaxID=559515 RepID=M4BLL9_HYAAE
MHGAKVSPGHMWYLSPQLNAKSWIRVRVVVHVNCTRAKVCYPHYPGIRNEMEAAKRTMWRRL